MEKLISEFSVGLFFWQTLIFLVLLFLLRKFAWKPILGAVTEREKSIEDALKEAEKARLEMKALKSDNDALLLKAREERDVLLKEAKEIKEQIIAESKGKAKEEAEKIISQAREAIANEKLAAITELKNQVATFSIEIAEKILTNELSSEDKQKALVESLLDKVNMN